MSKETMIQSNCEQDYDGMESCSLFCKWYRFQRNSASVYRNGTDITTATPTLTKGYQKLRNAIRWIQELEWALR